MPLFTELKEQNYKPGNEFLSTLVSHGYYQNAAVNAEKTRRELNKGTLYLFQKEFATILPNPNFNYIGSGDATTCVIVLLYSENSKRSSVGHFDGSDDQISGEGCSLSSMIHSFTEEERNQGLHAHLVGGFCDEKGQGKATINQILSVFSKSEAIIHLDTLYADALNTEQKLKIAAPKIQGAAIHINTGQLILVSNYKNRGPEICLRYIHSFLGSNHLQNIYDLETHHVTLGPYYYKPWTNEAKQLLALNDKDLLHSTSTSPMVEGSNFVKDTRRSLVWILKNPNCDVFFKGKPRVYKYNDGNWVQVYENSNPKNNI